MEIDIEDKLISVREAAKECDRNPETIRRWIWSGKLPAEKLGNQLFVKRSILKSFCLGMMVPHQDIVDSNIENMETPQSENQTIKPAVNHKDVLVKCQALREQIRERVGQLDVEKYIGQLRGDR
jgi:excisionase family DNA binding protein